MLFDCDRSVVTKHLKNIFDSGELNESAVCAKFAHTASDGKNYMTQFYNLDAVISVGYRVNSIRATQFRQWATSVLKVYAIRGYVLDKKRMENGTFLDEDYFEHLLAEIREIAIRGYVLDKKRMENGTFLDEDYFEHLLAEIREIRLSERRFYQKLTDIYATSMDYNKDAPTTRLFFKRIQNKMHYAVHGRTAAELIMDRADADKEHMGLTTWENAPDGKIVKTDVSIAKNYLKQMELEDMGRIVTAVLEFAESRAKRHIPMTMEDWAKRIDAYLSSDERPLLDNAGSVSHEEAVLHAETEFEKYRIVQDRLFQSDFDKYLDELPFDGEWNHGNVPPDHFDRTIE